MPITAEKPAFVYDPELENEVIAPSYENAPTGTFAATLVDLIPLGLIEMPSMTPGGPSKEVFCVNLVFAIEDKNSKGFNFTIRRRFTLSLHKKSSLKPFYETLSGTKVTPEIASGKVKFTVKSLADELIGKSALVNLVSSPSGEYTNVAGIIPLPSGMKPPALDPYTRLKDR